MLADKVLCHKGSCSSFLMLILPSSLPPHPPVSLQLGEEWLEPVHPRSVSGSIQSQFWNSLWWRLREAIRVQGHAAPADLPGDGASDPDTQLAEQTVYNVCLTLI